MRRKSEIPTWGNASWVFEVDVLRCYWRDGLRTYFSKSLGFDVLAIDLRSGAWTTRPISPILNIEVTAAPHDNR
jgi:hypothetical protein